MKLSKKLISILLTFIIMLGVVFTTPANISAAGTAKTVDEAMAWLRSIIGTPLNPDGVYGPQCVDLIVSYYDFLGVPRSSGNAKDYATNQLPSGFTRIKDAVPQAGDVLVYSASSNNVYGHVAIFESTNVTYHQNYYGHSYVERVTGVRYNGFSEPYWGVIRPNFTTSHWYDSFTAEDLGDSFFASLAKSDSGVYLANINGNVELANHETIYDNSHIWKFSRQSDNSYFLTNCASGAVMDVANAGTAEGTNVSMCPLNSSDAQKWYFYKQSDGSYVVRPKLCSLALDVNGGHDDFGTNVQLWTYNQSAAQKFSLIMQPTVSAPEFSVEPGDYKTLTTFKCKTDAKPFSYDLVINIVNGDKVTEYKTINMVQNNVFMYELPEGIYQAYARVSNGYSNAQSNKVTFEVSGKPVVGEDGWIYSPKLYSDVTSANYEIQYLHTYSEVASESPGTGWTKGDFVKKEYVNSGEPYWSDIELSASDTRVVVNYIYYHFCGGSTGNDANFAQTGNFNHYDWLPNDGVYEHSSHADYDDSRYKFYHLKWTNGSDAYCKSGVSCDGSFGSHGNRSCYWYKRTQYQDKVAVELYEYTKPSVWVSKLDSTADSVTYRYRLRSGGVFGDANGDGKVTVADATTIQKYCASLLSFSDNTKALADVDRNGRITVSDATKIQKFIAGIVPAL